MSEANTAIMAGRLSTKSCECNSLKLGRIFGNDNCVYTVVASNRLDEMETGPRPLSERKRWVTARRRQNQGPRAGIAF